MTATTRFGLCILVVLLASCTPFGGRDAPKVPRAFGPSDQLAAVPAPGRTGPYEVCEQTYDVTLPSGRQVIGKIYAPVLDRRTCRTLDRRFNLAVIAHADGVNTSYLSYDALGRHLASNALIVASVNRYPDFAQAGAWEVFDDLLVRNLDYLYGQSGVRDFLGDRVGLIGHSAGGKSVLYNASAVESFGKELHALILMSPSVNTAPVTLNGVVPAFLGIHVFSDSDAGTYGSKAENAPMQSVFRVYDEVGVTADPDTFSVEKDMLFISTGGHYYESQPFVLAYVNAFLQAHVNGHGSFRRFFKQQERPPSLTATLGPQSVLQMHEDRVRFVVDDFEDGERETNQLRGENSFLGDTFTLVQVNEAHLVDEFSPHHAGVLVVEIDPAAGDTPANLRFALPGAFNLAARRYLGLRATQVYQPELNPDGVEQSLTVTLETTAGEDTVAIDAGAPPLRFPPVTQAPAGAPPSGIAAPEVTNANGQTKNAMRSYLVSLRDFEGVDLGAVTAVRLGFGNVTQRTRFILDDLAFYGY